MAEIGELELTLYNKFFSISSIYPSEMFISKDIVVFLVENKGELLKSLGKNGKNIQVMEDSFGKKVQVFVSSNNAEEFLKTAFFDIRDLEISIMGNIIAYIIVPSTERGKAIGREGKKIKAVKMVLKEKYGINTAVVRVKRGS